MKSISHTPFAPPAFRLNGTKQIFVGLVLAVAFMAPHQRLVAAGPAPVNLGSTAQFTILAGTGITTAGQAYTITGNAGTSPAAGSYEIDLVKAQVAGTIYEVSAGGPAGAVVDPTLLTTATGDLTTAYNDAAGRTPIPTGPFLNPNGGTGNIGGMTLAPGLYKFTTTAYITGSDVTLMGTGGSDDVWIFQCAQDLQVGSGIQVILAGGAQAGNIFWQVTTEAVIGTSAAFEGTIMAGTAVTMDTTSTMVGRALASTAVTFDGASATLPTTVAPFFTAISITPTSSVTVVLSTTPNLLLTLQASPDLSLTNWTTIATDTPVTSTWTFTDTNTMATVPHRFYRAFITPK